MRRLALASAFFVLSVACSSGSSNNPGPLPDASTETAGEDASVDSSTPEDALADTTAETDTAPPASETCAPTFAPCAPAAGTNKHVRLKGTVVTPDKMYCEGEVLFSTETGKIVCAGADCSASPEAASAQVVCANGVVFPGLIDPHQHADYNHMPVFKHTRKYDNRNTWRNHESLYDSFKIPHRPFGSTNQANQILAQRYAEMRIAFSGGTAMAGTAGALLGNSGIAGWIRNVDSTSSGSSGLPGGIYADPDTDTIVVRDTDGSIDKTATATHVTPIVARFANATYRAFLPHIAEGIDVNARAEFDEADALGVIAGKTAVIHCTGCSTQQLRKMALAKTDLIWSPRSNLDLYGVTASVTTAKRLGVRIALGVDWTPSGSMNPIGELQCARHLNDTWYNKAFTDRELVEMATLNAAHAVGMEDQLGQLAAGYWADIAVVAGDRTAPYRALLDAKAAQIRMVTVGGRAIFGDPDALTGDVVAPMVCADVPNGFSPDGKTGVCGAAKKFCVDAAHAGIADQMKMILATAKSTDTACGTTPTGNHCYAYELFPLFRCDATPEIDRCAMGHPAIPRRASGGGNIPAVVGTPAPGTDDDGDGVANASDNCPKVFNPPFDLNTAQDDADGDGIGDVCDETPCTKSDGTDACIGDGDGDGVKDDKDNCPAIKNADQVDTDTDGKGDACDACPTAANPGTMPCPATVLTIPDVRNPTSTKRPAIGATFKLENVVVTGVKTAGTNHAFFVQDKTATTWAGIYVYIGSAVPTVAIGDEVSVQGKFAIFRGIEQVDTTGGGIYTKLGTATVPTPIVVTPAEIMTGGSKAKSHQSMLVQVLSVEAVTATSADVFKVAISSTDTNQLTVTSFIANDTGASPFPAAIGDKYTSITGLVYSFIATGFTDDSRLAPRSAADLVKVTP